MATKEIIKQILVEWSEFKSKALFTRDFDYKLLESDEILTIIGPRRAGKTYLCYQCMCELRKMHKSQNVIFINLEDERLYPLSGNELTDLWAGIFEVFDVDREKRIFLFIDEIQNVEYWSKWARRIIEQHSNVKLIITGSSSKLLSSEIATELRGRAVAYKVLPLSFREFFRAKGGTSELKNILYSEKQAQVKKVFNDYFKRGGFPAIVHGSGYEPLLREYYRTIFYRDLIERYALKNLRLFEDFLKLQVNEYANLSSITSLHRKLTDLGYKLRKNTINNYFYYAGECFLLFPVEILTLNTKNRLLYPKKIYVVDHGLIQAIRFTLSEDYGKILENIVYLELYRRGSEVHYYQGKVQCDFILSDKQQITGAVQVTKSLRDGKVYEREVGGLLAAMQELGLARGLIITEDEHTVIERDRCTIDVLPAWYWLLGV